MTVCGDRAAPVADVVGDTMVTGLAMASIDRFRNVYNKYRWWIIVCKVGGEDMLFMVIERFRDNDMVPVYQRVRQKGRSLPEGLEYVDSWIAANFSSCFQLMRCDDLRLIQAWILGWRGSGVTFEIVPVVTSVEARATVEPYLEPPERG